MKIEDTDLMAYMDGELSPARAREIEEQLAQSSDLREQLDRMRTADTLLARSLERTTPRSTRPETMAIVDDLARELAHKETRQETNLIPLAQPDRGPRSLWKRPFVPQAIAASVALFIGFGAGNLASRNDDAATGTFTDYTMGQISPQSALYQALETSASNQTVQFGPGNEASATLMTTFQTAGGTYCREFAAAAPGGGNHGIACRKNGGWIIKAVIATNVSGATDDDMFVTASDAATDPIGTMVMSMMQGDALSLSDEEKAIKDNWN